MDDDEPRDRDKKRDPFDAFDDIFERMGFDRGEFDRMFREIQKAMFDAMKSGSGVEPGKPFVTGFSFKMGPDGKPHIENFGNRPRRSQGGLPVISDEREPLTDIIEDEDTIAITMEIPGVDKRDIKLSARVDALEVSVDTDRRKYHKILRLPGKVRPETTKATYNNGVLDVTIERADVGEGVPIEVE